MAIDPKDLVVGCRFKFHDGDSENTVVSISGSRVRFQFSKEVTESIEFLQTTEGLIFGSNEAFITYTPKAVEVENDTSEVMAKKLIESLEESGFFEMLIGKLAQKIKENK